MGTAAAAIVAVVAEASHEVVEDIKGEENNEDKDGWHKEHHQDQPNPNEHDRVMRNRKSAQASRERKRRYLTMIEQDRAALHRENAELKEKIDKLERERARLAIDIDSLRTDYAVMRGLINQLSGKDMNLMDTQATPTPTKLNTDLLDDTLAQSANRSFSPQKIKNNLEGQACAKPVPVSRSIRRYHRGGGERAAWIGVLMRRLLQLRRNNRRFH